MLDSVPSRHPANNGILSFRKRLPCAHGANPIGCSRVIVFGTPRKRCKKKISVFFCFVFKLRPINYTVINTYRAGIIRTVFKVRTLWNTYGPSNGNIISSRKQPRLPVRENNHLLTIFESRKLRTPYLPKIFTHVHARGYPSTALPITGYLVTCTRVKNYNRSRVPGGIPRRDFVVSL